MDRDQSQDLLGRPEPDAVPAGWGAHHPPGAEAAPGTDRTARGSGWKKHAACRDTALEQFFEHRVVAGRPHAAAYRVAERFCAACPVVLACRADAEANDAVGLWGGQWRPATGSRTTAPVNLLLPRTDGVR